MHSTGKAALCRCQSTQIDSWMYHLDHLNGAADAHELLCVQQLAKTNDSMLHVCRALRQRGLPLAQTERQELQLSELQRP